MRYSPTAKPDITLKAAKAPIRGKIVANMDQRKESQSTTLPPEFRPSEKMPKLSIKGTRFRYKNFKLNAFNYTISY